MILVSSCPARPTNGSPCRSSSSPGASPTNISDAVGLPTPNTTCRRPSVCSLQRVHAGPMCACQGGQRLGRAGRGVDGVLPAAAAGRVATPAHGRRASRRASATPDRGSRRRRRARGSTRGAPANRRGSSARRRGAGRDAEQALETIEDAPGDRPPSTCSGSCLDAVVADEGDRVGVDLEPGVGAGHVVGDDEVDALAPPLGIGVRERRRGSRRQSR